jgi:hypothetical protein
LPRFFIENSQRKIRRHKQKGRKRTETKKYKCRREKERERERKKLLKSRQTECDNAHLGFDKTN